MVFVSRNASAYRNTFGRYTLSATRVIEVVRGFQAKQSIACLQRFLASIASEAVRLFDQPAAELAGRIAGDLDRGGQPIGGADPTIAAFALMHGLDLVTGSTLISTHPASRLSTGPGQLAVASSAPLQLQRFQSLFMTLTETFPIR